MNLMDFEFLFCSGNFLIDGSLPFNISEFLVVVEGCYFLHNSFTSSCEMNGFDTLLIKLRCCRSFFASFLSLKGSLGANRCASFIALTSFALKSIKDDDEIFL